MRSPGRRAAPRHRAPSVAARVRAATGRVRSRADGAAAGGDGEAERRPARVRRRGARISPALRRLVLTPTFAAGLGVVVAAFLAANMSRTVLHFSAPIPGNQCPSGGCHVQEPHGGTLASARPGVHIRPSSPAASGPATGLQPGWHRIRVRGRRPAAQPRHPAAEHHLSAGRALAGRVRRPDHDQRSQRDEGARLDPGPRLSGSAYRRRPGRTLGAGEPGCGGRPGRYLARVGPAAELRGSAGAAHGDRGGPAGPAVWLRPQRGALHVLRPRRPVTGYRAEGGCGLSG